jgi:hypothetical protein
MAWVQADLDAIDAAIATGARRVRFQTHEVEYHSLSDLLKVRAIIVTELTFPGETQGGPIFTEYQSGA